MRIWNLRLNLDDFNAAVLALHGDIERSDFLAGLATGCNGGSSSDKSGEAWLKGYSLGKSSRDEAEEYQSNRSSGGKKSAESRALRYGHSRPLENLDTELTSKSVRTQFEVSSKSVRTEHEVSSNQSTIYNLQSTNDITPPAPLKGGGRKKRLPGDYTSAFLGAWETWGGFRASMVALQDQYKPEHRYIAKSSGSKEDGARAWQSILGTTVGGMRVTEDLLTRSVRTYAEALYREAKSGVSCVCPMFATALRKPNFMDAIIYEVSNATK